MQDVVKSNALIQASYKPTSIWQMRLLFATMMQIKAGDSMITEKQDFVVSVGRLNDLLGYSSGSSYRHLARAADELLDMIITVDVRPNGDKRKPYKRKINVVSACNYIEEEGSVVLNFTNHIAPYISQLSSHFTKLKAKYILAMRSSYGVRLYEYMLQWIEFSKEREFEVDEFKEMFGLTDKYPRVAILQDKVIRPALIDINKHTNITASFGTRKRGRVITHIQFFFNYNDDVKENSGDLFLSDTTEDEKYPEAMPGESTEEYSARCKKFEASQKRRANRKNG